MYAIRSYYEKIRFEYGAERSLQAHHDEYLAPVPVLEPLQGHALGIVFWHEPEGVVVQHGAGQLEREKNRDRADYASYNFV